MTESVASAVLDSSLLRRLDSRSGKAGISSKTAGWRCSESHPDDEQGRTNQDGGIEHLGQGKVLGGALLDLRVRVAHKIGLLQELQPLGQVQHELTFKRLALAP